VSHTTGVGTSRVKATITPLWRARNLMIIGGTDLLIERILPSRGGDAISYSFRRNSRSIKRCAIPCRDHSIDIRDWMKIRG
jgi:hypothetical protein